MDQVLSLLCSQMETAASLSAAVGLPKSTNAQIVLWPWHIASAQRQRSPATRGGAERQEGLLTLSLILLSNDGIDNLVKAARHLNENPVLIADDRKYVVKEQNLVQELQVAIFNAAGIAPQPAFNYVLEA